MPFRHRSVVQTEYTGNDTSQRSRNINKTVPATIRYCRGFIPIRIYNFITPQAHRKRLTHLLNGTGNNDRALIRMCFNEPKAILFGKGDDTRDIGRIGAIPLRKFFGRQLRAILWKAIGKITRIG